MTVIQVLYLLVLINSLETSCRSCWNFFDTDLDVDANAGTYSADGTTYGSYAGLNTGVLMLMAGYGMGSYDIDTKD